MNKLAAAIGAAGVVLAMSAHAFAESPLDLTMQVGPNESVYAPPEIAGEEQGVNAGGVSLDLRVTVFTDYVFRGIERSETGGTEDSPNIQLDGSMRFELGKFPDLFMGVFTNIYDSDPISRFQEIRPYFGIELTARPLILALGNTFYIFPDRDQFNTSELWTRLTLDDSYFFRTDDPVFSPYVMAAWDYDKSSGLYVEIGIRHDFEIEDTKLVLSPLARIAYVNDNRMFRTVGLTGSDPGFEAGTGGADSGLQHYEIGLEATYALNDLLKIPARYGRLDFKGYLFYTDGIDNKLRADTELYGGVGIDFRY
jgi:hypothetical protein